MDVIKDIYELLSQNDGMRIKAIANTLGLDKYAVSEILTSTDNSKYWYQDDNFLWYTREGVLEIKEQKDKSPNINIKYNTNDISRYINACNSISYLAYLHSISNFPKLSEGDFRKLIILYREGNKESFNLIIEASQKFIIHIAYKYRNRGLPFEDLIQEGNVGLLSAIKNFKIEGRYTFPAYAKFWINQKISIAIQLYSTIVHIPNNVRVNHHKYIKKYERFYVEHEYTPSIFDICNNDELDEMKNVSQFPDNLLDSTFNIEDFDQKLVSKSRIDDTFETEYNQNLISILIANMTNRKNDIIISSFGIGQDVETLREIGDRYNITRERVRQIIESTMKEIRNTLIQSVSTHRKNNNLKKIYSDFVAFELLAKKYNLESIEQDEES